LAIYIENPAAKPRKKDLERVTNEPVELIAPRACSLINFPAIIPSIVLYIWESREDRSRGVAYNKKFLYILPTVRSLVIFIIMLLDIAVSECYNKYKRLEARARMEYESKFGPLTAPNECVSWEWTKGPWPWQTEKEGK
jgi:hypothetical protein